MYIEQIICDILSVAMDDNIFWNENRPESCRDKQLNRYFMIDNGCGDCIVFNNVIDTIKFLYKGDFHSLNDGDIKPYYGYYIGVVYPMKISDCELLDKSLGVPLLCMYEDSEWPYCGFLPEYSTIILKDGTPIFLNPDRIRIGTIQLSEIEKEAES